MRQIPTVELLWWEGCPSTERALAELRQALNDVGLGSVEVSMREITTDADGMAAEFVGSPTIRIDGVDVVTPGSDDPIGLACRVYRRRDGRYAPTPDPEDLRDALRVNHQEATDDR
jgi:hypothetical protein